MALRAYVLLFVILPMWIGPLVMAHAISNGHRVPIAGGIKNPWTQVMHLDNPWVILTWCAVAFWMFVMPIITIVGDIKRQKALEELANKNPCE